MKNRMNAKGRGELKAVGMGGDLMDDGERTEFNMIEFGRGTKGFDVTTGEPDEIARPESGKGARAKVVVMRLSLLSLGEGEFGDGESSVNVVEMLLGCRGRGGGGRLGRETGRVIAVGEEKRGMLGGGMSGGVVSKFSEGKEGDPIKLLIVAVGSKIVFKGLDGTFRLTIGLRMESSGKRGSDVTKGEEMLPKMGGKDGVTVSDDCRREAMETDNVGEE